MKKLGFMLREPPFSVAAPGPSDPGNPGKLRLFDQELFFAKRGLLARTGRQPLIPVLWFQESAPGGKNFRKNYEKIEKMMNFFNLLNMLAKRENIFIINRRAGFSRRRGQGWNPLSFTGSLW
jgi:hypothetical protein